MGPLRALGLRVLGGWAQRAEQVAGERLQASDPGGARAGQKKTAWHFGYGTLEVTEQIWRGGAGEWQRLASDFVLEEPFGRAAERLREHTA